ncbi:MAG: midcut-by-XrtH protein [Pseudomonadota bacterium]
MKHIFKLLFTSSTLFMILFLLSSPVFAGGVIVTLSFGETTAIPTLSTSMLIVLSILLATFAYLILSKNVKNTSRLMILSIVALGSFISSLLGLKLVEDSQAVGAPINRKFSDYPGVIDDVNTTVIITYINDTGSSKQIKGITLEPGFCLKHQAPFAAGECNVNKVLANNESCTIDCT